MEKQELPLVSVGVITYNSSKTVIETLDSIYNQTYPNLELIISDDCSKDNTVELCNDWLEKHKERFVRVEIVTVEKNTGVTRNINRACYASKGIWIKVIAGDDCLKYNCIEEIVTFVLSNPGCQIGLCGLELFSTDSEISEEHQHRYDQYLEKAKEGLAAQQRRILKEFFLPDPGWFYSESLFEEMGGFDEKWSGTEWSFSIKVLYSGYCFYALDKKLISYRISSNSISHEMRDRQKAAIHFYEDYHFFSEVRLPLMLKNGMIYTAYTSFIRFKKTEALYKYEYGNKKHVLYIFLKVFYSIIDPSFYRRFYKRIILK